MEAENLTASTTLVVLAQLVKKLMNVVVSPKHWDTDALLSKIKKP
jgi:hypothetical protein